MIELVISGGQTGSDQAGWRAARAAGIPTGGWMPKGFLTEDGPRPEYAGLYGAREHPSADYPPRTLANVEMADVTLWFGNRRSRGGILTERACRAAVRPFVPVDDHGIRTFDLATMIRSEGWRTINVAGNRASAQRAGFGDEVEAYLAEVFRLLKPGEG